jgi:transcriptional regulator GlxA family with amidase domain
MVEADHGTKIAAAIAKEMVLFLRRPGGQAQFSETLAAQARLPNRLSEVVAWATDHPHDDLSVPALAARAAMSERTLVRHFVREVGRTPSKFVLELRLNRAKTLLERSDLSIETIAVRSGFGSLDTLQRAFKKVLNVGPGAYRSRFGANPRSA